MQKNRKQLAYLLRIGEYCTGMFSPVSWGKHKRLGSLASSRQLQHFEFFSYDSTCELCICLCVCLFSLCLCVCVCGSRNLLSIAVLRMPLQAGRPFQAASAPRCHTRCRMTQSCSMRVHYTAAWLTTIECNQPLVLSLMSNARGLHRGLSNNNKTKQ